MTDIEIARSVKPLEIEKIAKSLKIKNNDLELYGKYKAKVEPKNNDKKGKLILVTAINPTSAGEGKTTVSIGLADALKMIHKKVCLALREPSLGPVFGLKGGATGGGQAQVIPMEDINLHFTGDFHAITSANNLLCSFIDNHIYHGNSLNINLDKIVFNRCLDLNDRALRELEILNVNKKEESRKEKFNITAASEIMAIMCVSKDMEDLKTRLGNILVAYDNKNKPIFAKDLKAENAMAILLKDAIKPNLVQTLNQTPAFIHLGPFANIAHGCNSIIATNTALSYSDYVVTEAGFGADLGAEKFLDTKCRILKTYPNAVVLVATIKALKLHGGQSKDSLQKVSKTALKKGLMNLIKHIENIKDVYKLPLVVAINKYETDNSEELEIVKEAVNKLNVKCEVVNVYKEGGKGAISLAKEVVSLCNKKNNDFTYCYETQDDIKTKIQKIATKIYGAKDVKYSKEAEVSLKQIKKLGFEDFYVIIAKTQYSLSDDKMLLGRPKNFTLNIKNLEIRSGAKFIVAIAGDMLLMPGLPKVPNGAKMEIENNIISGLF